ncbi:L-2-3-butanediol dehydrogenase [Apiospora aurea]|uniref:L-2-3-butanediol dehydrogenase n=1 Tax=Apiospora aurea TaxID=335848 RepID=A0ABR1QB90_9PEZI
MNPAPSATARAFPGPRSAIVTGSSQGIGKAIALRLAADGYDVCVNDVGANRESCEAVAKEIQGMGRRSCVAIADVSKRDEVVQLVQTSVKELGPLKTMVANAGITLVKPVLSATPADFERLLSVNVLGVDNCFAEAARQLLTQGTCTASDPGKLVAAASIAGFRPMALLGHYSATKWAVRGLTHAYAVELARHHITANGYAPGIVGTGMWDLIDAGMAKQEEEQNSKKGEDGGGSGEKKHEKGDVMRRYAREGSVLERVSEPEDVAKLVSFLASPDSDFVTGQTQIVDGGMVFT